MISVLIAFIPILLFLTTLLIVAGVFWLSSRRSERRRSPLNRGLLRSPGYSLVLQIEDVTEKIDTYVVTAAIIPVSLYAAYVSVVHFANPAPNSYTGAIYLSVAVGFVGWSVKKLLTLQKIRRSLRLGLDCEMAVGQELNSLVAHGYRVFHDIQADNFNIDHVVVGPNGVFAVETKGRSKPNRKRGAEDARVVFDGKNLNFPDAVESEPLEQARWQARWLSDWLTSAVGEKVAASPVLALPGWYIVRKKWSDVFLLNGKEYEILTKQNTGVTLSDAMIKRISHQLDQRCRDVEPKAYRIHKKPSLR